MPVGSFNLGAEFRVSPRLTLDVPLVYNPLSFSDNRKWKHFLFQPELRWWSCEPFNGHFFGLHTHYAFYNVGGVGSRWMKDYRFEGWLAGLGISYGYQWLLSSRGAWRPLSAWDTHTWTMTAIYAGNAGRSRRATR